MKDEAEIDKGQTLTRECEVHLNSQRIGWDDTDNYIEVVQLS
jgi:hypothetical protein